MNLSSCPESEASRRPRKKSRRKLAAANQAAQTQLCCFSVIHQWKEKVVVCVWMLLTGPPPAPASFYSGWRSAIFPAPPTDLELLEDVSGHWELSAVKRLCYLHFSRWRTHTSHCSCASWGCVKSATPQLRERPATSSRLIIKSWRRSDDKVAAADHLSPTLLKV